MFRKIYEVLFRNERMCATQFSTIWVAYLRMTEVHVMWPFGPLVYELLDALSAGTMTKFSWRLKSSLTTSRSQKNDSCMVLTECFSRPNSTFQNIDDRLYQLGKSVDFDILFLGPPSCILLTRIHDDFKILVPGNSSTTMARL